jgi:hypothetical protein
MSCAAATFRGVSAFDARVIPLGSFGDFRRFVGAGAVFGFGTLAAACALTVAAMAAAGLSAFVLSSHSRAPIGRSTIALAGPYPTLAGAADIFASARTLSGPAYVPRFEVATNATSAARALSAPIEVKSESARPPELTQVAKLAPAVAAIPLPPKRPTRQVNSVPLPRPYPVEREIALSTVRKTGAQLALEVAAILPPRPAEKRVTPVQEAHNRTAEPPDRDSRTAVYDIAAHTVYLPNGERLEAHSGLYDKMDDPRFVNVRMRGPTPPNVYDLTLREDLFHGVQAIRLNPVDDDKMFGRAGMLAHTYMLGPNGQSNGCVSFKDYHKFLNAYLSGQVERLVVVAHRDDVPPRLAHERRGRAERLAANN